MTFVFSKHSYSCILELRIFRRTPCERLANPVRSSEKHCEWERLRNEQLFFVKQNPRQRILCSAKQIHFYHPELTVMLNILSSWTRFSIFISILKYHFFALITHLGNIKSAKINLPFTKKHLKTLFIGKNRTKYNSQGKGVFSLSLPT